jgi:hypothetical protein
VGTRVEPRIGGVSNYNGDESCNPESSDRDDGPSRRGLHRASGVTGVVPAGQHAFGVDRNENPTALGMTYGDVDVSATALAAD